ncbi:2-phospho-L-lactate transferase [Methanococcus voltae]|uniref:2-phospho-L-lactate transferase n=1 Tax=Methanococcus voltae TaxID=2188 RepID=A0A8J7UTG8_METVO|nr:2-phospho-L-lactate transferase [Methanococcus voltae]MBP2172921.1 LPPG:FO 2-phospho-L-lactate transferase [Methanococcus voltae]MBP2201669.1 LPPG:FO 2-phospho-L-lactate transferase [Methanococcus voltae]
MTIKNSLTNHSNTFKDLKITILSGGTGTPKLIQGFDNIEELDKKNMSIIVNTGEDNWIGDIYLSPDVDTVLYTLSGLINEETWYGVKNDTFECHEQLKKYGFDEVLKIGDKDRALKTHKSNLIKKGAKLSNIIDEERKGLGICAKIYPMSNDKVETKILIVDEESDNKLIDNKSDVGVKKQHLLIKFHDFWINRRGNSKVVDVFYENSNYAEAVEGAIEDIKNSDIIIIGPSNPITSINPILSIPKIRECLKNKVVYAVSPIIGNNPVSGPVGTLMQSKGYEVSSKSVYEIYKDILDVFIIDTSDSNDIIDNIGNIEILKCNTIMKNIDDKKQLAKEILNHYVKNFKE